MLLLYLKVIKIRSLELNQFMHFKILPKNYKLDNTLFEFACFGRIKPNIIQQFLLHMDLKLLSLKSYLYKKVKILIFRCNLFKITIIF
jgi:hypothetical protein